MLLPYEGSHEDIKFDSMTLYLDRSSMLKSTKLLQVSHIRSVVYLKQSSIPAVLTNVSEKDCKMDLLRPADPNRSKQQHMSQISHALQL
jgi:hypothetical protein